MTKMTGFNQWRSYVFCRRNGLVRQQIKPVCRRIKPVRRQIKPVHIAHSILNISISPCACKSKKIKYDELSL